MAQLVNTLSKCVLLNKDTNKKFHALFNPKEISWDKAIPWAQHRHDKTDHPLMEFTGAKAEKLSVELFFDTYESKKNVFSEHIEELQSLVRVAKFGNQLRPPVVVFIWGNEFPRFKGVIESLAVKYTMFLPTGRPVRATATLKITHAGATGSKVRRRTSRSSSGGGGQSSNDRGHDPRSGSPSAVDDLE